jgi:hypothetical protein
MGSADKAARFAPGKSHLHCLIVRTLGSSHPEPSATLSSEVGVSGHLSNERLLTKVCMLFFRHNGLPLIGHSVLQSLPYWGVRNGTCSLSPSFASVVKSLRVSRVLSTQ